MNLIKSNTEELIHEMTKEAFDYFTSNPLTKESILHAVKILTGLRGVGVATASRNNILSNSIF